jgi:hypothetical protein
MSNYYISKCCGEQVDYFPNVDVYHCQKCGRPCFVKAVLDSPGGIPTEDRPNQEVKGDSCGGEEIIPVSSPFAVGTCGHSSDGEFIITDDVKTKCVLCGNYYKI